MPKQHKTLKKIIELLDIFLIRIDFFLLQSYNEFVIKPHYYDIFGGSAPKKIKR